MLLYAHTKATTNQRQGWLLTIEREGKEEWSQYTERLNHFILANRTEKSVFLAVIGPQAYKLLNSLIAPAKPGDKGYKDLVQTLAKHYKLVP